MDGGLILIAEDEPEIASLLQAYFEREGFRVVVAADGEIALQHHLMLRPDLVILDIKLPCRDGFEVLSELRRRGDTPVIMATALAEDLDKLSGLRLGADDYVVKPYNPLEVVARAKAVLRRGRNGSPQALRHDSLEVDLSLHVAYAVTGPEKVVIDLTLSEFRLLSHLIRTPLKVFSRAELLDTCLPESDALERTVDSHVSNLRRKLEKAGLPGYVIGVRGVGYRLSRP